MRCNADGCTGQSGEKRLPRCALLRWMGDLRLLGRLLELDSPTRGAFVEVRYICLD